MFLAMTSVKYFEASVVDVLTVSGTLPISLDHDGIHRPGYIYVDTHVRLECPLVSHTLHTRSLVFFIKIPAAEEIAFVS